MCYSTGSPRCGGQGSLRLALPVPLGSCHDKIPLIHVSFASQGTRTSPWRGDVLVTLAAHSQTTGRTAGLGVVVVVARELSGDAHIRTWTNFPATSNVPTTSRPVFLRGVVRRWTMGVLNCLQRLVLLGAMNLVSIWQAGTETQSGDVGMVGAAWFSRFSSRTLLQEACRDIPACQDPLSPLGLFLSPNCPPFIPSEAGVSIHFLSPPLSSESPRAGSFDSALPASAQCVPCLLVAYRNAQSNAKWLQGK